MRHNNEDKIRDLLSAINRSLAKEINNAIMHIYKGKDNKRYLVCAYRNEHGIFRKDFSLDFASLRNYMAKKILGLEQGAVAQCPILARTPQTTGKEQ